MPEPSPGPSPSPSSDPEPDGPGSGSGTGTGSPLVREHLVFFLGLVPVAIAAMRVYLMGQGDTGTTLTLVETLDLRSLMMGTFARSIGIFGVATTVYLFCRVFWPRIGRGHDGTGHPRDGRWGASGFGVLVLVFLASAGCLYPEQVVEFDSGGLGPDDLLRAVLWVAAARVVLLAGRRLLRWLSERLRRPGGRRLPHRWAEVGADCCDGALRFYRMSRPEVWILAPAVLTLFWVYLVTNDRMWLPAQVITVRQAPACLSLPAGREGSCAAGAYDPVVRHGGRVAFIGYVLERDDVTETVLRPGGGILTVPRDAVTAAVTCQFEAELDPGTDAPLIAHLPSFHPVAPERQSPTCTVALREVG